MADNPLDRFVITKVVFVNVPCDRCARRDADRWNVCEAFPEQIPGEILRGEHAHRTPFPGDHGFKYAPR